MKQVEYSKTAIRALRRMTQGTARRIMEKVSAFARGEQVDFKSLRGNVGRIRVGEYRVIGRNAQVLAVLDAMSRQQAYGKKEMERWK